MMPVAFDHIAIATHRIVDTTSFLVGELGGSSGFGGPSPEYRWWHWDYPGGGRLEVLEPDATPGGFVARFLAARGPGIHHVTFRVPDLRAACARARDLGHEIVGLDASNPHWREAFLHPRRAMGIVVQLVEQVERDPELPREWRMDPPPEPPRAPRPVRVLGLRMRTASRERALGQWGDLLRGEPEESPGELCFRWKGSGMRVRVMLDPASDDRSEAIELDAPAGIELPTRRFHTLFDRG
jgi:methylmalonyl-CoA/ethylmalonyl-CoA epimerase